MFSLFVVQKGLCPAAAAKAWGKSRATGEEIRQLARLLHPCPLPLPSSFPNWGLAPPLSLFPFHLCPPGRAGPLLPVILPLPPPSSPYFILSPSPLSHSLSLSLSLPPTLLQPQRASSFPATAADSFRPAGIWAPTEACPAVPPPHCGRAGPSVSSPPGGVTGDSGKEVSREVDILGAVDGQGAQSVTAAASRTAARRA